jgi:hypothetical protein
MLNIFLRSCLIIQLACNLVNNDVGLFNAKVCMLYSFHNFPDFIVVDLNIGFIRQVNDHLVKGGA